MDILESPSRAELLDTRVSDLLARNGEVLALLVDAGFTPLANRALRAALAPTVTLQQAFRLKGLEDADRETLLDRLEGLLACPS